MLKYPKISIIIVTFNAERTLQQCLRYIRYQAYPHIDEVLIVDGGSTDQTFNIAKKSRLSIRIINAGYPDNPEARRAIGIEKAKNEICVYIDSDNYINQKNWLKQMLDPLMEDKKVIASQTLRYAVPKNTSMLNRYFGLLGAGDPVAYYMGKADRLSWAFDKWNLLGKVIEEKRHYLVIEFSSDQYPTIGCNGIAVRKSILLKAKWKNYNNFMHTDVFIDLNKLGYNRFAVVKNEIFHHTADNVWKFISKRKKYMELHYQSFNSLRRYYVFNPNKKQDIWRLLLFIFYTLTFIEPLIVSARGFVKKRDTAWFLHPFVCLFITVVYSQAMLFNLWKNKFKL